MIESVDESRNDIVYRVLSENLWSWIDENIPLKNLPVWYQVITMGWKRQDRPLSWKISVANQKASRD
jgi:hypothetical protein